MAPQVGLEPTTLRLTAISRRVVGTWGRLYLYEEITKLMQTPITDTYSSKKVLPTKFTTVSSASSSPSPSVFKPSGDCVLPFPEYNANRISNDIWPNERGVPVGPFSFMPSFSSFVQPPSCSSPSPRPWMPS